MNLPELQILHIALRSIPYIYIPPSPQQTPHLQTQHQFSTPHPSLTLHISAPSIPLALFYPQRTPILPPLISPPATLSLEEESSLNKPSTHSFPHALHHLVLSSTLPHLLPLSSPPSLLPPQPHLIIAPEAVRGTRHAIRHDVSS